MLRVTPFVLGLASVLSAQSGDAAGEAQPEVPEALRLPASPPRSPAEQLDAFTLAAGWRLELVAAEPLVRDPVAVAFDPHGRLWVVEMCGYMSDVDGRGEREPVGSIAVLTDDDGDGAMDQRREFLTGLVLPRAVLPCLGGALVVEPPHLYWCEDHDGDLRCDARTIVASGFDAGLQNPEHAGNGLLRGLDNWIHLANMPLRLRRTGSTFVTAPSFGGGQWGLCHDDEGRLYYDYNSDALRMDLVPGHYAVRNSALGTAAGVNVQVVRDQSVHPARPTPTVNRGYRRGQLRDDGRLATYTAACAPLVHRGSVFTSADGVQVLVCEPAANLVARYRLNASAEGRRPDATLVESDRPFLSCDDERFRPVFLRDGPDGAIYVVDMYRGLIQHRNFVTTWLRKQVLARGLAAPIGHGRIWRLRRADGERVPLPAVAGFDGAALLTALQSPIGALRDAAQHELVDRGSSTVVPALRELLRTAPRPVVRLHALWTLEGLGALVAADLRATFGDRDPTVRGAALRCSEPQWNDREVADAALVLLDDPSPLVRWQLAHTVTEVAAVGEAQQVGVLLLMTDCEDQVLRSAVLSGLPHREVALCSALFAADGFATATGGRRQLLQAIGRTVAHHADPAALAVLREKAAAAQPWQAAALRTGLGKNAAATAPVDGPAAAAVDPERLARGQVLYTMYCAACHQGNAAGLDGLAPPLAESPWSVDAPARTIRIVLQGLQGPIRIDDRTFDLVMPGQPQLDDAQVADVLTFVRRSFGNRAGPVTAAEVASVRAATRDRSTPWTAAELEQIR